MSLNFITHKSPHRRTDTNRDSCFADYILSSTRKKVFLWLQPRFRRCCGVSKQPAYPVWEVKLQTCVAVSGLRYVVSHIIHAFCATLSIMRLGNFLAYMKGMKRLTVPYMSLKVAKPLESVLNFMLLNR